MLKDCLTIRKKLFISGESTGIVFYLKTALAWICGLEKTNDLDVQSSHSHDHGSSRRSITSTRREDVSSWHHICSYAAIIILALCAFVWAFFTDYRIKLS